MFGGCLSLIIFTFLYASFFHILFILCISRVLPAYVVVMSGYQGFSVANGLVGVVVQSAVAELVNNVSTYMQILSSDLVQRVQADNFKYHVCNQAQFLELQQLRLQLTDTLAAVSAFQSDSMFFQNLCREKDKLIVKLEEEVSGFKARLGSDSSDLSCVVEENVVCAQNVVSDSTCAMPVVTGSECTPVVEQQADFSSDGIVEVEVSQLAKLRDELDDLQQQRLRFNDQLDLWKGELNDCGKVDAETVGDDGDTDGSSFDDEEEDNPDCQTIATMVASLDPVQRLRTFVMMEKDDPGLIPPEWMVAAKLEADAYCGT